MVSCDAVHESSTGKGITGHGFKFEGNDLPSYMYARDAAQAKGKAIGCCVSGSDLVKCNCKHDLVSDADYCHNNFIGFALICAASVQKSIIPNMFYLCRRMSKLCQRQWVEATT